MKEPAVHYAPEGAAECNVRNVPAERLTNDLDAVSCGNCLSGRAWRNDISVRDYKRDYERFYGPGGFLDRAGQTTPASSTTAPQARAALEELVREKLDRLARHGLEGAGDDILAAARRAAAETVMAGVDACIRLAVSEAAGSAATEPARQCIDLTGPGTSFRYAEILTAAGIIRVNTGLEDTRTRVPVVVLEIEPNLAGLGIVKTGPGGDWDLKVTDHHGTRTDVRLTRKAEEDSDGR